VLVVRDLATGYQLVALPVKHATADVAAMALLSLFRLQGPPLVLKTDNGSHLIGGPVASLLRSWNVTLLRSPPGTARYNGAVEAGIGSLKARLHHVAAAHGRVDGPTCEDLEAARLEANAEARPWGRAGPSPEQRWNERSPITIEQREAFGLALAAAEQLERCKLLERRGVASPPAPADLDAIELNGTDRATVARRSTRRALIECGYLNTRRTVNTSTEPNAALSEN
jgi:transposase InsO family protein